MFADSHYDVYVTAPGTDATRSASLPRFAQLYRLDRARQDAVARGERILLRSNVDEAAAQRIINDLRALGFKVDLETRHAELEAIGIDGASDERDAPRTETPAFGAPLFDVNAGLVGIDGSDLNERPRERHGPPATGVDSLLGLFGAKAPSTGSVLVDDEPYVAPPRPPPVVRAPPPPPIVRPPPIALPTPPPSSAGSFRPPSLDEASQQLALDRAPPPQQSEAKPVASAASDTVEAPRCPTHDIPKVRGRCAECDAEDAYVKSRVMGGQLRRKPQLRIGIGVGAGLLLGWIVTAPMSRHGDMRVQELRDQAQRERERPTEEGQARASQLDNEAEDAQSSEHTKTFGVWALITAAVAGAWLKLS